MKNAKEAIKYGIETLKVSPEEMFSLIESSKDYDGDDYPRWLASKIIKLAEEDGVGYSQLLVKRFNIISDLLDNDGEVFKSDFIDYISGENVDIIYGLDEYDKGYSEDLDWFKGIDLDVNNSEFLLENFEDIYNKFLNGEEALKMLLKPSRSSADKSSELYADAKSNGIICKNEGMLMLYRLCMLVNAFSSGRDIEVTILTDVDFLMDEDIQDLMSLFLSYFKVEGYFVKASDIYENTLNGTRYAVMKCISRTGDDELQDCIELNGASYVDGGVVENVGCYRFTKSNKSLLSELNLSDNDTFELDSKKIPFYSTFDWEGQICSLVGATDKVEVCNAIEFNFDKNFMKEHKYALKKLYDNKYKLDIEDYERKLEEIITYIVDKVENKYKLYDNLVDELKNIVNYKNYSELNLEEKENIIKQLMNLLKCNSTNANFKFLNSKYSSVFGRKHSKTINHATIISKSVTGIRESRYEF